VVTRDLERQEVRRNVGEIARVWLKRNDGGRQGMMTRGREEERERKLMYGGLLT